MLVIFLQHQTINDSAKATTYKYLQIRVKPIHLTKAYFGRPRSCWCLSLNVVL